ncbi:MAG: hypothetical protein IRY99_22825 [Isosphaeraceae bacterium]|nr:hypothetical protein [Isosphaeraceae bacterium]
MDATESSAESACTCSGAVPEPLILLVCVAVALGVFLRLDGIDRKSLWVDEVFTIRRISQPTLGAVIQSLEVSPLPPLYYALLWGWVRLWGLSDLTLRALPVGLGLLALPLTYGVWVGLIGRQAARWAVALLALNAFHIAYSLDAKMYAAVWLLATISSGAFLHAVRGGTRRLLWLLVYGVSSACLPLTSYVGIVPLAVQGLYLAGLYGYRPERRLAALEVGIAAAMALLPFALWLPVAVPVAANRVGIRWIPPASWERAPVDLYRLFGVYLLGYQTSDQGPIELWGKLLASVYAPCVFATAALLGRSLVEVLKRSRRIPPPGSEESHDTRGALNPIAPEPDVIIYLAMWLVAPVIGALVFSLSVYSLWGVPRYLTGAAPALPLWVATALGSWPRQRLALSLGVTLLGVNLAFVAFDRTHETRTPWRAMARAIEHIAAALPKASRVSEPGGTINEHTINHINILMC